MIGYFSLKNFNILKSSTRQTSWHCQDFRAEIPGNHRSVLHERVTPDAFKEDVLLSVTVTEPAHWWPAEEPLTQTSVMSRGEIKSCWNSSCSTHTGARGKVLHVIFLTDNVH